MEYTDEDIAFAHKILHRRDELDEREVETWLQKSEHVELLNSLAAGEEENLPAEEEDLGEKKSRQMTLRWSLIVAIVLILVLIISRLMDK